MAASYLEQLLAGILSNYQTSLPWNGYGVDINY